MKSIVFIKERGLWECKKNYVGIKLLTVPGKVLNIITTERMEMELN